MKTYHIAIDDQASPYPGYRWRWRAVLAAFDTALRVGTPVTVLVADGAHKAPDLTPLAIIIPPIAPEKDTP